jgi:hypothetical protein
MREKSGVRREERRKEEQKRMPRSRVKIQPVEDIEWDVVQICAKRVRPNGDVEVPDQYALKVDVDIAEGPLYQKFLVDEAVD